MKPFGLFTTVKYAGDLAPKSEKHISGDQSLEKVSEAFMDVDI
jgi:hypothetical protein